MWKLGSARSGAVAAVVGSLRAGIIDSDVATEVRHGLVLHSRSWRRCNDCSSTWSPVLPTLCLWSPNDYSDGFDVVLRTQDRNS